MNKKEEANARLRYIRALERFLNSIVSYLFKTEDVSKEVYDKKVLNGMKLLDRVLKVPLYKSELQELEKIVDKIILYKESDSDIEDIKKDILYSANQQEKSKNFKKYKKPKHSKKYDGWE